MAIAFEVNGKAVTVQAAEDTPLLWVLRDEVGLTGSPTRVVTVAVPQTNRQRVRLQGAAADTVRQLRDGLGQRGLRG